MATPVGHVECPRCSQRHRYATDRCAGCGLDFKKDAPNVGPEDDGIQVGSDVSALSLCEAERRVIMLSHKLLRQGYWRCVRAAAVGAVDAVGSGRSEAATRARAEWVTNWWNNVPSSTDGGGETTPGDFFLCGSNVMAYTSSPDAFLTEKPAAMFTEAREGMNRLINWCAQLSFGQDVWEEMEGIIAERELAAIQDEPTFRTHEGTGMVCACSAEGCACEAVVVEGEGKVCGLCEAGEHFAAS